MMLSVWSLSPILCCDANGKLAWLLFKDYIYICNSKQEIWKSQGWYAEFLLKIILQLLLEKIQYCKFYPNKVIQIDRLELSTEISHVKKLSRRVIQKLFYPNLTLLILPDFITVIQPYLPYMTIIFDINWRSIISLI